MLGLQMLLFVVVLILSNGQSISQISHGNNNSNGNGLCFVVCLVIFMAFGFVLGQIRTLQRFAWLSNFAVWINLLIIFICMTVVAHSPPNFRAKKASFGDNVGPGPIKTYAGTPPAGMASGGVGFVASLNGLSQAVYSYGGCMTFISFLAAFAFIIVTAIPQFSFISSLIGAFFILSFTYTFPASWPRATGFGRTPCCQRSDSTRRQESTPMWTEASHSGSEDS
ncbi:hypothetical protein QQZ08_008696 [Neonectria magnoliae]|uniref:Uncharacterized protein n=1 Tax=Neonectria magnoliae TaxID=2732573 RepID=A0ABR1HSK3_9HYPO